MESSVIRHPQIAHRRPPAEDLDVRALLGAGERALRSDNRAAFLAAGQAASRYQLWLRARTVRPTGGEKHGLPWMTHRAMGEELAMTRRARERCSLAGRSVFPRGIATPGHEW